MTVAVFLGPSLSPLDARKELDAVYLPPARVGDVYRAACGNPRAICLIDGVFERSASVWHKEILWAMSEGIHVFGAASIGALRAAEMADYGMEGIGAVYESYRRGTLDSDDEVAVAFTAAESGYRSLSNALVNIRATMTAAVEHGVVRTPAAAALLRLAKDLFYADRTFEGVLRAGEREGLPDVEIGNLRRWLPDNKVDLKRLDALAVLRTVRERLVTGLPPKRVDFRFEHTQAWEMLQRRHRLRVEEGTARTDATSEAIFDELRLRGVFVGVRRAALGRLLALSQARESGKPFTDRDVADAEEAFRRERGLLSADDFRHWLQQNDLHEDRLKNFFRDDARVRWVDQTLTESSAAYVPDELRTSGTYRQLRLRADEKKAILLDRGHDPVAPAAPPSLDDRSLWSWYFTEWRRGDHVPDDLAAWAERAGYADLEAFRRSVLREYLSR